LKSTHFEIKDKLKLGGEYGSYHTPSNPDAGFADYNASDSIIMLIMLEVFEYFRGKNDMGTTSRSAAGPIPDL